MAVLVHGVNPVATDDRQEDITLRYFTIYVFCEIDPQRYTVDISEDRIVAEFLNEPVTYSTSNVCTVIAPV